MTKKTLVFILSITLVVSFIGICLAFEQGNERKGKYLFRNDCRTCHKDDASAAPLGPSSKTQAQWERAFEKFERLECAKEWEKLSVADRNDILTYLYNHAYDSPQPATCE